MKEIGEPRERTGCKLDADCKHYLFPLRPGQDPEGNRAYDDSYYADQSARDKHLTDAELAAEHWRQISVTQSALARATRSDDAWKRIITEDSRLSVMGRFVRFPSYDD